MLEEMLDEELIQRHFDVVSETLERLSEPPPKTIQLTKSQIRIVGAFSSGKSRVMSTILGARCPAKLKPKSALTRETAIPFEVCYGPAVKLCLVRIANEDTIDLDEDKILCELDEAPDRSTLLGLAQRYQLPTSRMLLRLELPEERMLYTDAAGEARSISLIDTLGWDSDEHELSRQRRRFGKVIGLFYVTYKIANEVGLAPVEEHELCAGELCDEENYFRSHVHDRLHIWPIITRFNYKSGLDRILDAALHNSMVELLDNEPTLKLLRTYGVDLSENKPSELEDFEHEAWHIIDRCVGTIDQGKKGARSLAEEATPTELDAAWEMMRPLIKQLSEDLARCEDYLQRHLRSDPSRGYHLKLPDRFNGTRLVAKASAERRSWVRKEWGHEQLLQLPTTTRAMTLSPAHSALSNWWHELLSPLVLTGITATQELAEQLEEYLDSYQDDGQELDIWLNNKLSLSTLLHHTRCATLIARALLPSELLDPANAYTPLQILSTLLAIQLAALQVRDHNHKEAEWD